MVDLSLEGLGEAFEGVSGQSLGSCARGSMRGRGCIWQRFWQRSDTCRVRSGLISWVVSWLISWLLSWLLGWLHRRAVGTVERVTKR